MCCGEAFWKRVVAFSLTFGLGVFVAGFFLSAQVPQAVKPIIVPAAVDSRNCVPFDESLEYHHLPHYENEVTPVLEPLPESDSNIVCEVKDPYNCYYVIKKDQNESNQKPEDKKKSAKAEKEKPNNSADPQYYAPTENSAEFKNLLHKEKCFETQAQ